MATRKSALTESASNTEADKSGITVDEEYGFPPEEEEPKETDAQRMLKEVNSAISAIMVGGQSYKIGSRALTRADLKELYAMRRDLKAEAEAEKNSTGLFDDCYVAVFDRR